MENDIWFKSICQHAHTKKKAFQCSIRFWMPINSIDIYRLATRDRAQERKGCWFEPTRHMLTYLFSFSMLPSLYINECNTRNVCTWMYRCAYINTAACAPRRRENKVRGRCGFSCGGAWCRFVCEKWKERTASQNNMDLSQQTDFIEAVRRGFYYFLFACLCSAHSLGCVRSNVAPLYVCVCVRGSCWEVIYSPCCTW